MFTVIIPTYNNANLIHRSIESVLRQTVANYEVIVINDGSTDHTLETLSLFRDKRIRVITKQNQGVSVARNTGITNASFPWVCFLDADDEWLPNHLEILSGLIQCFSDKKVFATAYYTQYVNGYRVASNNAYPSIVSTKCINNLFTLISRGNATPIFHTNSMCIHKVLFGECGMFESGVGIGEDTDMWYRIAVHNDIVYHPIATTVYHREASTATKFQTYNFEWPFEERCRAYIDDSTVSESKRQSIIDFLNLQLISKSRQYLLLGDRKKAVEALTKIWRPVSQRQYYLMTLICLFAPRWLLLKAARAKSSSYFQSEG